MNEYLWLSGGFLAIICAVSLAFYFGQKSVKRDLFRVFQENLTVDMGYGPIVVISAARYSELLEGDIARRSDVDRIPKDNPISSNVVTSSNPYSTVKEAVKKIEQNLEKKQKRGK